MACVSHRILALACVAGLFGLAPVANAQWGDVTGKIEFSGEVPKLPLKVAKGDATAKDAVVCAAAMMLF